MILKGNQRGNGRELANHLMHGKENEHIELHDLRGFAAEDLHGAMQEAEAIAKGPRCKNHLFSLSLNPPQNEQVSLKTFELAISRIEGELGFEGQPRAIVFHEKEGRRHCHAVWSRIDGDQMKAIKLDFYKRTLNGNARDLHREHGWEMPNGFRNAGARDPLSISRHEWQQAKRTKQDPKAIKEILQRCWADSDNRQTFETALREQGYFLARGDQRGYVAVDWRGEVYSLSRSTGAKAKDLTSRLGEALGLQSVEQAKTFVSERMTPKLKAWAKEAEALADKQNLAAQFQREQMVQRHRHLREQLKRQQEQRVLSEARQRAERTPRGLRGLWGDMKEIDEWVVHMSSRAWHMAQDLNAHCERSGLDCYLQTQLMLCAASDPAEIALWSEVWVYVQTLEGAGWIDRLFVVIDPDEDALEASLLCPTNRTETL